MSIRRIVNLIDLSGITAKTLTQKTGLAPNAITEWKKGKAKPSADALVKIAEYFNVPIEYLLGMGVFSNWEELQTIEAREAIIEAVRSDYPSEYLTTGNLVLAEFRSAINESELTMIRFFSWAVNSVSIKVEPNSSAEAHIDYSFILKQMISKENNDSSVRILSMNELFDDFKKRQSGSPYDNLSEDEKQLLDMFRGLADSQKGQVFKDIAKLHLSTEGIPSREAQPQI